MTVVFNGDLRNQRKLAPEGFANRQHGLPQFIQIAKGFEDNGIGARFGQRLDLFTKEFASLREADRAQGLQSYAQRPYGSRDEGLIARGFPGDANARLVDLPQFFGESKGGQALAVGSEGVGFNDLRTGAD